jgi:hypothetical protein
MLTLDDLTLSLLFGLGKRAENYTLIIFQTKSYYKPYSPSSLDA